MAVGHLGHMRVGGVCCRCLGGLLPPDDQRAIVVTFGPGDSNLPSAPAFPVLIGNALDWLARVSSDGAHRTGPIALDEGIVRVTDPKGEPVRLTQEFR